MRLRKRMKNKIINWSNKFKIATYMVCLLVTVGILCICVPIKAQASERHLTGDTEVSTVINPAGTATTHEEVGSLNTANTVSITYNNGNGQINGLPLRESMKRRSSRLKREPSTRVKHWKKAWLPCGSSCIRRHR